MRIVILTVDRKPQYVHRLITSVRNEWKETIHLMVGGGSTKYLDRYKGKGFTIHKAPVDEFEYNVQKATYAYGECLKLSDEEGVLIIEDDTLMLKGWFNKFRLFKNAIQDDKFVFSLGDCVLGGVARPDVRVPSLQRFQYRINVTPNGDDFPLTTVELWYDSHAVYFPRSLPLEDLAAFIQYFGQKGAMHDISIGNYAFRKVWPIFIEVPKIAKNVGAYTSQVGKAHLKHNFGQVNYGEWQYP